MLIQNDDVNKIVFRECCNEKMYSDKTNLVCTTLP